jgi:hypothetical protein
VSFHIASVDAGTPLQRPASRSEKRKSGNAAYSMWWNGSTRQCIQGLVSDGRIQSLNPIVEGSCL